MSDVFLGIVEDAQRMPMEISDLLPRLRNGQIVPIPIPEGFEIWTPEARDSHIARLLECGIRVFRCNGCQGPVIVEEF